jgi:hypothetical protein
MDRLGLSRSAFYRYLQRGVLSPPFTPFGDPENPALKQKSRGAPTSRAEFSGVTQTVINTRKDSDKTLAKPVADPVISEPNRIGTFTLYDFDRKSLTAYAGLLPVATMLERLGFQQLVEEKSHLSQSLCLLIYGVFTVSAGTVT